MTPMIHTPFQWTGRIDHEETGISTRWHQHVQDFTAASGGGYTLIGFACDEGVRRNSGRQGAAHGPHALRQALGNLPILSEPDIFDFGDVQCVDQALESAQSELANRVAQAMHQNSLPLVLGGGHEVAWGSFQGIRQARPELKRLLIINFDAHFDLRSAQQGNSGTPFRQMQEWCAVHQQAFDYRVLGISRFANTQALFERADALGVRYWLDQDLQYPHGLAAAQQALNEDLARCDAVYLTICLDVLPGSCAPGVSAPAALGVPLGALECLMDTILATGKLIAADIAELNPELDRDKLTAKIAARMVARIARQPRGEGS